MQISPEAPERTSARINTTRPAVHMRKERRIDRLILIVHLYSARLPRDVGGSYEIG